MDVESIEIDRIDRLISSINAIINQDGKVSDDEELLFQNILENLSHYRIMLMDFAEDGEIDTDERNRMNHFRLNIIGDARLIAFEDETFSADEVNIIKELRKFQINENY